MSFKLMKKSINNIIELLTNGCARLYLVFNIRDSADDDYTTMLMSLLTTRFYNNHLYMYKQYIYSHNISIIVINQMSTNGH